MAANRQQTMLQALKTVWSRGGVAGLYQGLIPWVCIILYIFMTYLVLKYYKGMD